MIPFKARQQLRTTLQNNTRTTSAGLTKTSIAVNVKNTEMSVPKTTMGKPPENIDKGAQTSSKDQTVVGRRRTQRGSATPKREPELASHLTTENHNWPPDESYHALK